MTTLPDFPIHASGKISTAFLERNLLTFTQAALFVRQLPYGRNRDKDDLTSVFTDNRGTCSTKHALLKQLAEENNYKQLRLMVGLYRMSGNNTPKIASLLKGHQLEYLPEAHCYLKCNDLILDYTRPQSKPADFIDSLIEEIEISPSQITSYKINYHKNYLKSWLTENNALHLTLEELWAIREQCIQKLAGR